MDAINQCQIQQMEKAGKELDPTLQDSCERFSSYVDAVEATLRYNYQVIAYASIRESNPDKAAGLWKQMIKLCDEAIRVLRDLKDTYPNCGTHDLYGLALDYRIAADKRWEQNLQDSQWAKVEIPSRLFPSQS